MERYPKFASIIPAEKKCIRRKIIMKLRNQDVPSGGSFSYFVSFDVLKTPFIFTAGSSNKKIKLINRNKKQDEHTKKSN